MSLETYWIEPIWIELKAILEKMSGYEGETIEGNICSCKSKIVTKKNLDILVEYCLQKKEAAGLSMMSPLKV